MGNQPPLCCADTTGLERVEIVTFDNAPGRGSKARLLRRVIESFRPVPRRDSRAPPKSGFFKGKFASSTMEIDPLTGSSNNVKYQAREDGQRSRPLHYQDRQNSIMMSPPPPAPGPPPPTRDQLRTLSSMSTQSEFGGGGHIREARSDKQLTRRLSYCSDREGVEDEREPMEPEGNIFKEATE